MIDESDRSKPRFAIRCGLALAAALFVAVALLAANLQERCGIGISSWHTTQWRTNFGWPLISCRQHVAEPDLEWPPESPWTERSVLSSTTSWPKSLINISAGIALTICTAAYVLLVTAGGIRARFSLATLFAGLTIAGALLALVRYERSTDVYFLAILGCEEVNYYPASLFPWWICTSLFFGMGCTLYALGWAAYWLVRLAIGSAKRWLVS